jgi:hypothetical protein
MPHEGGKNGEEGADSMLVAAEDLPEPEKD